MGGVFLLWLYIEADRADPASKCAAQHRGDQPLSDNVLCHSDKTPCEVEVILDYRTRASLCEGEHFFFACPSSLHSSPLLCLAGAG